MSRETTPTSVPTSAPDNPMVVVHSDRDFGDDVKSEPMEIDDEAARKDAAGGARRVSFMSY